MRLLRFNDLTLQKAVDIIKAAEQTEQQVKYMKDGTQVNTLKNRYKHDVLTDEKQRMFRHAENVGKKENVPNVAVKRCQRSTKYPMTTINSILAQLARTRRPHAEQIKLL